MSPQKRRRLKLTAFAFLSLLIVGAVTGGGTYLWFSRSLPSVGQIRADQFPIVSEVYDENGEVIGEFFVERRYILAYDQIPQGMIDAITSAEDADFFEHGGIDYVGIVRAAVKNVAAGEVEQGASTITMQLAKSLLLSPERKMQRKIKEAILARRIEKNFSKEEILALYLNHVFFGRGAYGVEGGSREFFGRHLDELSTAEFAMIAALPKAPSTYSNPTHFAKWKGRQEWILDRMAKLGKITHAEAQAEKVRPIVIVPKHDRNLDTAPYFVEYVRQQLVKQYGDEAVWKGGLRVYTTADAKMSRKSLEAVREGLRGLDKRQGWRGALRNVPERDKWPALLAELDAKRGLRKGLTLGPDERVEALVVAVDSSKGKATIAYGPDHEGKEENGVQKQRATLLLRDASWARTPDPAKKADEDPVTNLGKVVKPGDVVIVEPKVPSEEETKEKLYEGGPYLTLEQEPLAQGALLAMDPHTGAVRAMVGGYDFAASEYNRAVQSRRQPGSAFKPIFYAAALDRGYTPSTVLVDSPIVYADAVPDPSIEVVNSEDPNEEELAPEVWKPKNYGAKYYGDTTFRTALVLSRNVISIKILQDIGVDYGAEYALNLGLEKEPARDLSMALGTSEASLLEMTRMYSVFANGGKRPDPFFIRRVVARDGTLLEYRAENADSSRDAMDLVAGLADAVAREPETPTQYAAKYPEDRKPGSIDDARDQILRARGFGPGQVMDPVTAYIVTDLMKDVVRFGTATRANIGRPVAGKTGTTNDEGDAWFIGYTPDLVSAVWVGFDDPKKQLGREETGGHTAVPIWTDFMVEATKGKPMRDFPQPAGIVRLQIDRESGLRACPDTESPVYVAFREGTEPVDYVCRAGATGMPIPGLTPTNSTNPGNLPSGLPPE